MGGRAKARDRGPEGPHLRWTILDQRSTPGEFLLLYELTLADQKNEQMSAVNS